MKNLVIVLALVFANIANAESLIHAKESDIEKIVDFAVQPTSAYRATYIGETYGRVYFEYVSALHVSSLLKKDPKYVVYWCLKEEISKEQLETIIESKKSPHLEKQK